MSGREERAGRRGIIDPDGRTVVAVATRETTAHVGATATAPAANTVLADTGALAAGEYEISGAVGIADTLAAGKCVLIEHRNAANGATLKTLAVIPAGDSRQFEVPRITIAANERVRAVVGAVAGAASSVFGASIHAARI